MMIEAALTKKQIDFLKVLITYIKEHQFPPTIRELCELTGLKSTSTVKGYIDRLVEKGILEREDDKPRTLRVVKALNI
ncbi:hypothetical protein [Clostridium magnum]|uniref:LexA repressor n=1 Tax=Clostridium magnum DSM 2767 TaxID=1121326 RepID=A0A161YRJ3_9CLOT|nr:hypothetical protein [Clostridium magnum]KZL93582.1 LexA repressor [Clostridium magnum DSM 2767]SHI59335.1 LexA DNA binding domain-containing protein [Clostridium magnum DSM 2767]